MRGMRARFINRDGFEREESIGEHKDPPGVWLIPYAPKVALKVLEDPDHFPIDENNEHGRFYLESVIYVYREK